MGLGLSDSLHTVLTLNALCGNQAPLRLGPAEGRGFLPRDSGGLWREQEKQ